LPRAILSSAANTSWRFGGPGSDEKRLMGHVAMRLGRLGQRGLVERSLIDRRPAWEATAAGRRFGERAQDR
jgi:hypothetical protein